MWFRAAFVALLVAGVVYVAVPAASVGYGLRMSTGKATTIAGSVVTLPVQVTNRGFLGIDGVRLHMEVLERGAVVFSKDVGPLSIPPGGDVAFELLFLNASAPGPFLGNLSEAIAGSADLGGMIPVGVTVSAAVAPAAAGQGTSITFSAGSADIFYGVLYGAMVVAVVCIEAAMKGYRLPAATAGALKVVEGAVLALLFYLLLGGGVTDVKVSFAGLTADFSVVLTLALILLELAGGARAIEGALEVLGSRPRTAGP